MMTRPLKTDMLSIVRGLIFSFHQHNFDTARYVYLPIDLFDHMVDRIEDEFRSMGMPEHVLDEAVRYWYLNVEVLPSRTNDIVVSAEPLP